MLSISNYYVLSKSPLSCFHDFRSRFGSIFGGYCATSSELIDMNLWTDLVEISFGVKYRLSTLRENYTEVISAPLEP